MSLEARHWQICPAQVITHFFPMIILYSPQLPSPVPKRACCQPKGGTRGSRTGRRRHKPDMTKARWKGNGGSAGRQTGRKYWDRTALSGRVIAVKLTKGMRPALLPRRMADTCNAGRTRAVKLGDLIIITWNVRRLSTHVSMV